MASLTCNIWTKHRRGFSYVGDEYATIANVKALISKKFGLEERDQYYNRPGQVEILANDFKLATAPDLELVTDDYLNLDQLKSEADELVMAAGKDMSSNFLMTATSFAFKTAHTIGAETYASFTSNKQEIDVHRNALRMLKRTDKERVEARDKPSLFKGFGGGFVSQLTSNTLSVTQNAFDGVSGKEVNVVAMRNAYESIGDVIFG